ncbi:MAG: hypothetical protein PVI26_04995 [Chitinispirillia bacterium]|jgi:hypothetical protein
MKLTVILFYLILTIYQCILSQEAFDDDENIFENNSSDSIHFSIPESLVLDLITQTPQIQDSTDDTDNKEYVPEKDWDTAQSFYIEDNQDNINNQQDNLIDTISYENKENDLYESDITDETADPDIIIIDEMDEDSIKVEKENDFQKNILFIFVDHSQGISLPRFNISPKNLSFNGKPSFIFDVGIFVPFYDFFYGGISMKYLKLALFLSESNIISSPPQSSNSKIDTKEKLTFISIPFKIGMRFKLSNLIPYFYLDFEPAFLATAIQSSVENINLIFNNSGSQKIVEKHIDLNIRENRTKLQLFIGGGVGLEIIYDYGSLFADIGCQYALLKTVLNKDFKSMPFRKSKSLFYFPITLGLRFYL